MTPSRAAVTALVALLVFDKVGVGILRRREWFDLDLIWWALEHAGRIVTRGVPP